MPISTTSIIHYTDTFQKLAAIIKEGFAIKYCSERLQVETNGNSAAAHPMICFCDIPLSQSYEHFNSYGSYGIGLSKEWANKMEINPVLYLVTDSSISKSFHTFLKERRDKQSNLTDEQKQEILRMKCFTKNYSGPLKRSGHKTINDYKFYDEREWRFVPTKEQLQNAPFSINNKSYQADKEKYNRQISQLRFTFEPKDISYIIVKETSEITLIIDILRNKFRTLEQEDMDLLLSKICSAEQIINDY